MYDYIIYIYIIILAFQHNGDVSLENLGTFQGLNTPNVTALSMLLCDKSFDHSGIFSTGFVIKLRDQGSTTPENQDTWVTKLFTVAPDISEFLVWQSFQFA